MLGVLLLAACGVPAAAADEPNNAAEGFAEPGGYTTTVGATTTDAPTTQAPTTNLPTTVVPTTTSRKVFVCKFVDIPGVGERLQSGQNPISVSVNAIPLGNVKVGSEFADRHGRSLVIAFDVGQPEPDPSECLGGTTTTTTYPHATTTTATSTSTSTSTSTTQPATTTSTSTTTPTTTTSAPPAISLFGITPIGSSCTADVPFIDIRFGARTDLDGRTGSLAIFDLNGNLIETRGLTYRANTTVRLIYPGATTDAQGIATDWPGWVFTNGVWVPDPTDAAWRDGLRLVYTLDGQTASAQVTYPPDTATCSASPPIGPVPSGATTTLPGPTTTVPGTTVPGR